MKSTDNQQSRHRGNHQIDDEEYRRLRQAEDQTAAEYQRTENVDKAENELITAAENDDDMHYPKSEEPEHHGPTYTPDDFLVVLPEKVIRIAQDSHLSWLIMFYLLPREFVEKRPDYLDLPRRIDEIVNNEHFTSMLDSDAFDELVWDCYNYVVWQAIEVPDGKDGYMNIPGSSTCYSEDFPLWRLSQRILVYIRRSLETEMEFSFQKYFTLPQGMYASWMPTQLFYNMVINLTERIVIRENFQPIIDAIWENRQPEDYRGSNLRKRDFLRSWYHNRNHPHLSYERMADDGIGISDPGQAFDQKVQADLLVEQFEETLTAKDKQILELRMNGMKLEDIAQAVGYSTASAVQKRINRIANAYEAFVNPPPDKDGSPVHET